MDEIIGGVQRSGTVQPTSHPSYRFSPKDDLIFDKKNPLPGHANGMTFTAYDAQERMLLRQIYYSVGGGFVVTDTELQSMKNRGKSVDQGPKVPYPFASAKEMLQMAQRSGRTSDQMKRANEETVMK